MHRIRKQQSVVHGLFIFMWLSGCSAPQEGTSQPVEDGESTNSVEDAQGERADIVADVFDNQDMDATKPSLSDADADIDTDVSATDIIQVDADSTEDSEVVDADPGPPCEVIIPPEAEWRTGPQEDGSFLLPGGRALERVGPWLEIGGFPSDLIAHPTLGVAYLTVAGRNKRELVVLDVVNHTELQRVSRAASFYGLEIHPEGNWLYASGGGSYAIERFAIDESGLLGQGETLPTDGFSSGMALSPDGSTLWVGHFGGELLDPIAGVVEVDTTSWTVSQSLDLDAIVWDLLFLPASEELYVSDLGGAGIYVIDTQSWTEVDQIQVPTSPAGMESHPGSDQVWVAVTGADAIATIDPATRLATQWTPVTDLAWIDEDGAPLPYSNVNALDYDPVGNRLYATRGADNAVSVFEGDSMELLGAFPTAWYPTSVVVLPGYDMAVVGEGKGFGKGPDDNTMTDEEKEVLLRDGGVSFVPLNTLDLEESTAQANAAFGRPQSVFPFECDGFFPLPMNPGQSSPIEHVILIVKENKTFDCVFGDLENMDVDVDPSLVRWGEEITPNLHALAREFCISDNFYSEVPNSDVGHLFLTAGHLTEFTERMWKEDAQFGINAAFPLDDPTTPAHGNLFTHLLDHGVTTRIYGEIVGMLAKTESGEEVLTYSDMNFPGGFIVNYGVTDTEKAEYVASRIQDGELAQFTFLLLPNDHTNGTAPGTPSPESMVADNDFAVGRVVEAVSNSPFWDKTLIIITQDDTQGCDDHVDIQRAFAILVSPWVRRNHVSHLHTSFPSIMTTINRILGAPPMGRADATALPFVDCFSGIKNSAPFGSVPRTYPEELNPAAEPAPGAEESAEMSWRSPDRNPGLGIILDAYRLWKMGQISREEAEAKIKAGPQDEETWEEWVEESYEDTLAFDQEWKRLKPTLKERGITLKGRRDLLDPEPNP